MNEDCSPDECVESGIWEVEPLYYSTGKGDRRGKAFRSRQDGELRCFEAHDMCVYKPGDHVYVESCPQEPYVVATISCFKMTKRDLTVVITRYYRPEEVPQVSLSLIAAERGDTADGARPRELFSSDTVGQYPVSTLRGKCAVYHVRDVGSARECDLSKEDSFFVCLNFNPESTRLASVQGEIRIGPAHQAVLPGAASSSISDERDRDELLWKPGMITEELETKYIKLARTFRICSLEAGKINETERNARTTDLLLDDAIVTLHRCSYHFANALKEMNANDNLLSSDANFMTPEDTKKFGKGIKTLGKNFARISRELLPLHSRDQLVAFYYLWKKTQDATKPKVLNRQRANGGWNRGKNGKAKASRPASTELNDYASASEVELEQLEPERRVQYACHHCYGKQSRDWHHAGRDHHLLCTDCRMFFKKYGQLRPVDRPSTVPPCLFKRSNSDSEEDDLGVRTRAGKRDRRRTPSLDDRSPSAPQSVHEFDIDKVKVKNGKRRKSAHHHGSAKKKKEEEKDEKDESKEEVKDEEKEESPEKPDKMEEEERKEEDDIKKETEELKEEDLGEGPAHMNGEKQKEEEDEDVILGDQVEFASRNACFVRSFIRPNAETCARTDLTFRHNPDGENERNRRKREEERSRPPPVVPPKKETPQENGLVVPAPRPVANGQQIPAGFPMGMDPRILLMQQQAAAIFDQQQQQMQMKQQMQLRDMDMLMRAHGMGRGMASSPMTHLPSPMPTLPSPLPFSFDQRMMPFTAFPGVSEVDPMRLQMELMLQAQAAQNMAPMMNPEMQQLATARMMEQLLMQSMQGAPPMGVPLPMSSASLFHSSDMMRRLQQESFRHQ